jgi:hypothetical protein
MKPKPQKIERTDGRTEKATIVRHLTTQTTGLRNISIDLYRLRNGEMIACEHPDSDCRVTPRETDYPIR